MDGETTLFKINNVDDYIKGVRNKYRDAPERSQLNISSENLIRSHIGEPGSRIFSTDHGLPGLHAEVRATNDFYNTYGSPSAGSRIQVSTVNVTSNPKKQGLAFDACNNCSGILTGSQFDILAGRSK